MPKRELAPIPPKEFPYTQQDLQGFAENYEIIAPVHKSNVSQVYSAKHLSQSGFYAVKFSVLTARLENEARAGELTEESPYVVDYEDCKIADDGSLGFVVTPYTFNDLGQNDKRFFRNRAGKLKALAKISKGLVDIHGEGLVHRDIKPKNIFLEGVGGHEPVIGDLGNVCENGHSHNFFEEQTANILPNPDITMTSNYMLTTDWAAPEQYDRQKRMTNKIDVFSFGLVVCDLLLGVNPVIKAFKCKYPDVAKDTEGKIVSIEHLKALVELSKDTEDYYQYLPTFGLTKQGRVVAKLLKTCLSADPGIRPDAEEVVFDLDRLSQQ